MSASKFVDPPTLFSDIPTPVWAALSGAISAIGTWFVGLRNISVSIERARIKMTSDALTSEGAERAAFRATLMAEITALRVLIKECDAERDLLRGRINTTEGQILVLKASNEIMERWVAFFKDRSSAAAHVASRAGQSDAIS